MLYVPRPTRLLLCLSYRQHINLVLTYLLLVRLVDPGSSLTTRYGSAAMMDIFFGGHIRTY